MFDHLIVAQEIDLRPKLVEFCFYYCCVSIIFG